MLVLRELTTHLKVKQREEEVSVDDAKEEAGAGGCTTACSKSKILLDDLRRLPLRV